MITYGRVTASLSIILKGIPMKYLFFDIEGASPKLSTIATFGYVLTDENFNVIQREDILMNPNSKYDWYVLKHLLSYTKAQLSQHPKFDNHYPKLKALLEDNDTLVCGYSILNDLKYLHAECSRYSLPPFEFSFMDVQTLADKIFDSKNQIGIERAYDMLNITDKILLHRSDEDAFAAMKVAHALCKKESAQLTELCSKYACTGKTGRYPYVKTSSQKSNTDISAE
jgi:DNA polymerase III alpha subunit (gram-positive type)